MASKVQVAEIPSGGSEPKGKAGPPPSKSDFPATPAQSAEKVQQDKLGDTVKPEQHEASKLGGKPGELRELGGKPVTSEDAAHIAAAEAAAGKSTGAGSLAARAQSAAAANEREGAQGSQQTSKPSANGASKRDAPEALSDKPGERQADKKRDVTEPKVHYYKEKESKEEDEGGISYASALRRPKEEVEVERREEAERENGLRKWLVPGAVAVLVVGVAVVVVSAFSKNKQHSSRR
ncbi:hypothetical protein KFL_000180530 [Klebsormidium nitens]|uniref:SMP domain-containing protein n=1 Tax=Klebsormidium nitens TaxID=105231 RepID=A0A1Y1HJQ4_KLENI|nr:hypothetical protein KFL_000180530 [Klebsormidium nitens]|eukprot:GAQ78770.1 hypothetical protein KFL_000180530 [Klebsormidium nitens]